MTTIALTIPTRPGLGRRLRDLGFHRCEIDALVAETQRPAEHRRPRIRAL